jgi:hypothetical protein
MARACSVPYRPASFSRVTEWGCPLASDSWPPWVWERSHPARRRAGAPFCTIIFLRLCPVCAVRADGSGAECCSVLLGRWHCLSVGWSGGCRNRVAQRCPHSYVLQILFPFGIYPVSAARKRCQFRLPPLPAASFDCIAFLAAWVCFCLLHLLCRDSEKKNKYNYSLYWCHLGALTVGFDSRTLPFYVSFPPGRCSNWRLSCGLSLGAWILYTFAKIGSWV